MDAETLARPAPRSPLKIQPEEYVETPSSSASASPAESCGKYEAASPREKPWKRTASLASSVDSSTGSVGEVDEEPEGSIVAANGVLGATERSLRMQKHLQAMQRRVGGLQQLMLETAHQARSRAPTQDAATNTISYVAVTTSTEESTGLQSPEPVLPKQERLELATASPAGCAKEPPPGESATERPDGQEQEESSLSDEMAALFNRIEALEAEVKETAGENVQLRNIVHKLEVENSRLQALTAFNLPEGSSRSAESRCDQESSRDEGGGAGEDLDGDISRLTGAIFGEPSAFQRVMEEDLAVLKNHERCQHKLHELWDTIRTLRTFVETYEFERDAMQIQRDEAIAEAERADLENVKLASSSNPQQKIRYLQQVKKDNQALRRKNRALNARLAKQAAKLIRERNGCPGLETDSEASRDSVCSTLGETQAELDVSSEAPLKRTGEEILCGMRDRSGVLAQRLERLRQARQELPADVGEECSDEASESEFPNDSAVEVPLLAPPLPATSARSPGR